MKKLATALILTTGPAFAHTAPQFHTHAETQWGAVLVGAGLIALDIDHFKTFNDTYGHDAGDAVLKMLAEVLQTLFREDDVPCRMGGEEFIVMLPGADVDRTEERAEDLRAEIEAQELRYGGDTLKVTASLGVAVFPRHGASLAALMQDVDQALYRAKDAGRNTVETVQKP